MANEYIDLYRFINLRRLTPDTPPSMVPQERKVYDDHAPVGSVLEIGTFDDTTLIVRDRAGHLHRLPLTWVTTEHFAEEPFQAQPGGVLAIN